MKFSLYVALVLLLITGCQESSSPGDSYGLTQSEAVLVTSAAGAKLAEAAPIFFTAEAASQTVRVRVRPEALKQVITGIGTSFTESSAFVLAHLPEEERQRVMTRIYSEQGANFSLARTPIGSTDFSVEGRYSYAPSANDQGLEQFSIAPDQAGFDSERYPSLESPDYDVLPMIQEALAIKSRQRDSTLNIIASAWTAPPWMKTIDDWFIPGSEENDYQGTGGALKPGFEGLYADYLIRYLDAYQEVGVSIWGITPVNEPEGNSGQWESMHFTPESQAQFIKDHLGPKLHHSGYGETKLLVFDQNRDALEHWTDIIYGDAGAAQYVYGAAIHWYSSTVNVYEDVLEQVHQRYPGFDLIHTEGTIDDLGKVAPGGIKDPEGFQESGWFNNDAFWWQPNATDWAYTATWAPNANNHPKYTPTHRYARNIIGSLNHWVSGWIDWNIVLDERGGPNHVGNFCGAPIMIHRETGEVYETPIFHILAQFSRTIRPGDRAVSVSVLAPTLEDDALHVSATRNPDGLLSVQMLNTQEAPITLSLEIGGQSAEVLVPANALQTVRVRLSHPLKAV